MVTKYTNRNSKVYASAEKLEANKHKNKCLALSSLFVDASYEDRMNKFRRKKIMNILRKEKCLKMMSQGLFDTVVTGSVTSALEPTVDRFSSMVSDLEVKLSTILKDSIAEFSGKMYSLALALMGCFSLYKLSTVLGRVLYKGFKVAMSVLCKTGTSIVLKYIDNGLHCQSDLGGSSFLIDASSIIISFLLLDEINIKNFIKVLSNDKKREGVVKSYTSLSNLFSYALERIKCFVTGDEVTYSYSVNDAEVSDWLDNVKNCKITYAKKNFVTNRANYELISSLVVQGLKLKYKYGSAPKDMDTIKAVIRMANMDLDELLKHFEKSSFDKSSIRVKPLTIVLKGKSGVGKSALTIPLLDNIMMRTMKTTAELEAYKANNMDFIYSRAPETEYWDGYYGQKAVVIDDFMQADELRVSNALVNEAFELIRMSNTYPMLLHKAHLEDKGNSYLMSRVILCSTNNFDLRSQVIHEQEALTRRFDVSAIIYPKKEYCVDPNSTLGSRRLKKLDSFNPDVYEIHIERKNGNLVVDYKEFCDHCVEQYRALENQGVSYLSEVSGMRDEVFHDAMNELEPQGFLYKEFDKVCGDLGINPNNIHVSEFFDDFPLIKSQCDRWGVKKNEFKKNKKLCEALLLHATFIKSSKSVDHKTINEIYTNCNEYFDIYFHVKPFPSVPDDIDIQCYEDKQLREYFKCQSDFVEPDYKTVWEDCVKEVKTDSAIATQINDKYAFMRDQVYLVTQLVHKRVNESLAECKGLATITLIFSVLSLSFGVYKLFESESALECNEQAYSSMKNIVTVKPKSLKQVVVNMSQQCDDVDPRIRNNFMSISRRNVYSIVISGKHASYGVFIGGRQFVINKHIYDNIVTHNVDFDLVPLVSVISGSNNGAIHVPNNRFKSFITSSPDSVSDVIKVEFDSTVREHRDITSHFITTSELKTIGESVQVVVFVPDRNAGQVNAYTTTASCRQVTYSCFNEMSAYVYPVPTKIGDCGSLALVCDTSTGYGKILSFHGAGGNGMGCGVTVPEKLLTRPISAQSDFNPELGTLFGHKVIDVLDKPVHIARDTKLRKSVIHGWNGPSLKQPAALKVVNGVDPFDLCLSRYDTPDIGVSEVNLLVACNNYSNKLMKLPSREKRILTFQEAVEGIHGDPYVNGIPRGTSAGYPWCNRVFNGKKEIFGFDGPYEFDSKNAILVQTNVYNALEMIKNGERPNFIYMDALKDELRPIAKVKDLKTRMISCCPIELTILTRMYFGQFAAFMMDNKIYSGSAVGINPFSKDWSDLAAYLGGSEARCVAGDFTSFDCTQSSDIIKSIVNIINDWYGDDNDHIRNMLWTEVYNSKHLHNDVVVEFTHGLPSGHPLTSIANSMFVNIAMRLCWIEHNYGLLSSIDYFDEAMKLVAYGDDNISSLTNIALNAGFDFTAIKSCMSTIGLIYTPEDKLSGDYTFKSLHECTFLKRGFVDNKGIWDAPLDLNTVLEMPNWYRKGPGVMARQIENIENCLKELSIHGDDVYETYSTILLNEAYKYKDILHMSFINMPIEYYRQKCVMSWVDEESLGFFDFSYQEPSNVSHLGLELSAQADINMELGLNRVERTRPADNFNLGRQSSNSQNESSVTTPVYNAVNSTVIAEHDKNVATGFLHDAEERKYEPFPIKAMDPAGMSFGMDNIDRSSIIKLLATPVNIRTTTLSSATTAGTTIMQINLPFDSANNGTGTDAGQGMWLQRLNAYQGFKATAVVNFQVNVNRFAQGRLLAHYIPGQNDSVSTNESHRFDLCTKSQNPNVQINLNRDTTTQFRIPYVSAWPCYDLTRAGGTLTLDTSRGSMGVMYVVVYSPLVGATSLPLNVWLHFEDVELFNPTYAPQSDFFGDDHEVMEVDFEPQANLTDKETPEGVFSGPLMKVSKVAGILSEIPSLSSLAGTASWFTRLASRAAMALGFAKPDIESRLVRVVNQGNPYYAVGDGEMACYKLGMSCSNKLDVLPGFAGNDLDEMSTEYVCNRPAYLKSFSWSSSDTQGTLLTSIELKPDTFQNNYTIASDSNIYTMTPFSAVSALFAHWRADIVLTFKIVKTEFHTGRLSVAFRPGFNSTISPNQETYLPREIIDIKESDTFVITVPYCSLTPFVDRATSLGVLSVRVLNVLNAPSSVSSSVEIITEVSACNVHFNGLDKVTFAPVTGGDAAWVPQSDFEAPREKSVVMSGLKQDKEGVFNSSRYVCGEAVTSLKQYLMRSGYSRYIYSAATSNKSLAVLPFTLGGMFENSGVYSYAPFGGDALSFISSFYALARGSIRYNNLDRSQADKVMSIYTTLSSFFSASITWSASAAQSCNASVPLYKTASGSAETVVVSQWGITHSRQVNTTFRNTVRTLYLGEPATVLLYNTTTTWSATNFNISRCAGDDYQLGFFIGVPVLYRDGNASSVQ